uniref:Reverse transcriptase domain-containing protein n=1 Tax=Tanacetum cinerariifolium TaxID=118510 RepID=A0A6L2NF39_TANCI|nr:reverse transcriptase domain-containing protein [Tanacetum cinerariifolium]
MISNEHAVKLRLKHEVKRGNKEVKKELIVVLRGEIYFVKFIINPEEDDVEPRENLKRTFLHMTKAITNFGAGTITIYPEFDPFLEDIEEEEKSLDDQDHLLDFNLDDIPLLGDKELPPFVCKMGKSNRNKKRSMENLSLFYQDIRTSSSAGGHLTQEEAAKEALSIRISQKFALLEEEEAIKRIKGKALKEKHDPGAFIFLSDWRGRIVKSDSDDEEEYRIKRNKFGATIYRLKPAPYLNCNDPTERPLALQEVINSFRNISVWKKEVSFLGSLRVPLKQVNWKPDYKGCYTKEKEATRQWHTEIRLTDPYGNIYLQGFTTKKIDMKLLKDAKSRYNTRLAQLLPRPPRASMQDLYDRMEIRQEAIKRMEEPTTHLVMLSRSMISIISSTHLHHHNNNSNKMMISSVELTQAPCSPEYVPDPIELEDHVSLHIPEHLKDLVPADDEAPIEAYIIEVASAPTPPLPPPFLSSHIRPPHTRAAMAEMRAAVPSTYYLLFPSGIPPLLPIPLLVPSTSRRAEIPKTDTPPRKRLLLTAPRPGCEMVNIRVSYQVDVRSRESSEFYSRHHDAQEDRATVRAEIEARRHEWQRQTVDDFAVQHIMRTQALEAGAHIDTLEDTAILYSLLSITGNSRLVGLYKMAPKRTTWSTQVPPAPTATTITVTEAQLQALIDQGVTSALAAHDALRSINGDDSHNSGTGELALLCGRMFPEESDKIEKYIEGLPDMIHGSVVASKPKTAQEAVAIATELMDMKIRTFVERQTENKRKQDDNNNQAQQQPLKKQGVAIAYTAGPGERKEYAGTLPLCNKCKFHYNGQCTVKNQGHYRSDCPELKNQDHGNQARGTGAHEMVHALEGGETNQDLNDAEDDINA